VSTSSFPFTDSSNQYRLYYEKDPTRLSACVLTIHGLLHIAWGIKVTGPVWTYWAFAMERHCNVLLQAVKSRRHPYASIASFVTATHNLTKYDYSMISMKPYSWALKTKKATRLYMILVRFANYTIAVHLSTKSNRSRFHTHCPPKI
jgi:hypothetical protein